MTKYFLLSFLFIASQVLHADPVNSLEDLEWDYRIIIIDERQLDETQQTNLEESRYGIDERHVIWFIVNGKELKTNLSDTPSRALIASIERRLRRAQAPIILIGKDGGIKARATTLRLDNLFDTIDAMPMRQIEMQR